MLGIHPQAAVSDVGPQYNKVINWDSGGLGDEYKVAADQAGQTGELKAKGTELSAG